MAKYPLRYRNMTLKELSDEMHAAMMQLNLAELVHEACDEDPDPVLTPAQTYQKLLRNGTEKVRLYRDGWADWPGSCWFPTLRASRCACPASAWADADSPVIRLVAGDGRVRQAFPRL